MSAPICCQICGKPIQQLSHGRRTVCWPKPGLQRESFCWYRRKARDAAARLAHAKQAAVAR